MKKLNVLIQTIDEGFGSSLSEIVMQCGADVAGVLREPDWIFSATGVRVDLMLLDIRDSSDAAIRFLGHALKTFPNMEVLLINKPDNIRPSIHAMQAGARDEILVPIDTSKLREKIEVSQSRLAERGKALSLAERFNNAMAAVTFAQAGEFETALDLINEAKEPNAPQNNISPLKPHGDPTRRRNQ